LGASSNTELLAGLIQLIAARVGSEARIENIAAVPGGASRETWRFDLVMTGATPADPKPLVLRRQLGGKIYDAALDVPAEFAVIRKVFEAGVPCPRPLWLFPDLLGRPAMVSSRVSGESIGRRIVRDPSLAEARSRLAAEMGAALALVHQVDVGDPTLATVLPAPKPGQSPAQAAIEQMEADLNRIDEPHPALELVLRWLRRNEPPRPDRLVLVHGDFRIGNALVTPAGLAGVIDWEFAHVGEPAEDLAWGLIREWRFGVDQLRFGGVGSAEQFSAAYEQAGGDRIDRSRVDYWEIIGNARWAVGALNQARRHLSGEEPNVEFASLGRRCAEMELEAIRLIRGVQW
jgi:aminoglycoside phosphotransferase (APT) family kinase protein